MDVIKPALKKHVLLVHNEENKNLIWTTVRGKKKKK